jgi:tetratricopeptide (TPR) repeat protein
MTELSLGGVVIRGGLRIGGIPYTWETNLDDEEIKTLYEVLVERRVLLMETLTIDHDTFEMRGGVNGFKVDWDEFVIHGRIVGETIHAMKHLASEIEEAQIRCSQEEEEKKAKELRRPSAKKKYEKLMSFAINAYEAGMYDDSIQLLHKCLDLNREFYFSGWSWDKETNPVYHLFKISAFKNDVELGLSYIDLNQSHKVVDLALCFEGVGKMESAERIYRIAIEDYGDCLQGIIYKRYAICLERQGKYREAITLCDEALARGVDRDGTKGGIEGRKKRLLRKLKVD